MMKQRRPKPEQRNTMTEARTGSVVWRRAAYALLGLTFVVWFGTLFSVPPASLHGWLVQLGFASLAAVASLLLGNLISTLLSLFHRRVPELYRWVLFGSVFLLFNMLMPMFRQAFNVVVVTAYVVVVASLFGAGIGGLNAYAGRKRTVATAMLAVGVVGIICGIIWCVWPGPSQQLAFSIPTPSAETLGIGNPIESGMYSVSYLTYGSGTDKRRSEYAQDVTIRTEHVDVSQMVSGGGGVTGWLRRTYWGFGLTQAPLNARVWYPEGTGPFALVLIVHGNHSMDEFSDPGYEYLGQLLATRGYIAASVDQNFLNGAGVVEAVLGGLEHEDDARAYLLLEHLRLWHEWNDTPGHLFDSKVDTSRIALIGHSRGGEAAATAAAFNRLPSHPDNAAIRMNYGFDISTVIAIAPSDGRYLPRQQRTELVDVNYLVLQGSADGDTRSFSGSRQYDRVTFLGSKDYHKAAVYIYGANHGQFNTEWGLIDLGAALWFINRKQIMPEEEQRALAKLFISSFLELTLGGRREYTAVFSDPMVAQQWVPQTAYFVQYQASDMIMLASFEEDMNLETATYPGARITGANLTTWREEPPMLGWGGRRDSVAVRLGWNGEGGSTASYTLEIADGIRIGRDDALVFDLASLSRRDIALDFSVKIVDRNGREASLPLSHMTPLTPQLPYRMYKPPLRVSFESEPVFATYLFKASQFMAENQEIDLGSITQIAFVFDGSPIGEIFADNIGVLLGR